MITLRLQRKKLGLECPTAADAMRPVIRHFGNVNRSSVNDALRKVHSFCSPSTTIDVQRPTLCDPVRFQLFADPQTVRIRQPLSEFDEPLSLRGHPSGSTLETHPFRLAQDVRRSDAGKAATLVAGGLICGTTFQDKPV